MRLFQAGLQFLLHLGRGPGSGAHLLQISAHLLPPVIAGPQPPGSEQHRQQGQNQGQAGRPEILQLLLRGHVDDHRGALSPFGHGASSG